MVDQATALDRGTKHPRQDVTTSVSRAVKDPPRTPRAELSPVLTGGAFSSMGVDRHRRPRGRKKAPREAGLSGGRMAPTWRMGTAFNMRRFSSCRRNYLWGDTTSYQREPRLTHDRPALTGGLSCCGTRRREEE